MDNVGGKEGGGIGREREREKEGRREGGTRRRVGVKFTALIIHLF